MRPNGSLHPPPPLDPESLHHIHTRISIHSWLQIQFFYIYSLIHPVLEKVGPSSHLHKRRPISVFFFPNQPICIFPHFIQFIHNIIPFFYCILRGTNPFSHVTSSRRRNFFLIFQIFYIPPMPVLPLTRGFMLYETKIPHVAIYY